MTKHISQSEEDYTSTILNYRKSALIMNIKIINNDFINYKFIKKHYLLFLIFHAHYFIFEPALVIPLLLAIVMISLSVTILKIFAVEMCMTLAMSFIY